MNSTMNRKYTLLRCAAVVLTIFQTVSCIRNDIPYPRLAGEITAFEVEGQIGEARIDSQKRQVTVELEETADLERVRVIRFEITDGARSEPEIAAELDLSEPCAFTLYTYPGQEYLWIVSATQQIERYVRVRNQVGETEFDLNARIALVKVSEDQPLSDITITEIKLGPEGSVIEPDPMQVHDFTGIQTFTVKYRDIEEVWSIRVVQTSGSASLSAAPADAYARRAVFSAGKPEGETEFSFEYRLSDETVWTPVLDIVEGETDFTATVTGLEPGRNYVYRAKAGSLLSDEVPFATETPDQIPNSGFDFWNKSGKTWYPNPSQNEGDFWWDSGNEGTAIAGRNATSPETSFLAVSGEGKQAARLESISILGIFAGGNLYTGDFLGTVGLKGGRINFGRPFATRPDVLKGYYCYEPKTIDKADAEHQGLIGQTDQCQIYIALTDWNQPFEVNNAEGPFLDLANDPAVIAYGELVTDQSSGGEYKPFEIRLEYRNLRKPKYVVVSAVASRYADYFTGGVGSLLYVDEFELVYE